jgi:hypothetical protein
MIQQPSAVFRMLMIVAASTRLETGPGHFRIRGICSRIVLLNGDGRWRAVSRGKEP